MASSIYIPGGVLKIWGPLWIEASFLITQATYCSVSLEDPGLEKRPSHPFAGENDGLKSCLICPRIEYLGEMDVACRIIYVLAGKFRADKLGGLH